VRVVIIIVACEFSHVRVAMEFVGLRLVAIVILASDLIVRKQLEWRLNLLTQDLHSHRLRVGCGDLSHVSSLNELYFSQVFR
jgi:hypothetical protein